MPEVAFVSYSSENTKYEKYLREFIAELRVEIYLHPLPAVKSPTDTLFFDSDNIETGEAWMLRISNSVTNCKVLVAFCSPHFNNSRFCGKEVHIFLERVSQWQAKNGNTPPRAIISVVWHETELPKVLTDFQFKEAILPAEYPLNDLRTLCRLDEFDGARKKFVTALAKRIRDALKQDLPPLRAVPHFDLIPSAFETPPVGARYGVAFVNFLQGGADPYALEGIAAEVCGKLVPYRVLKSDADLRAAVGRAKANKEAILIAADLPTLTDRLFQNTIAAADAGEGDQMGLVVAGVAQDVEQQKITVQGAFPNSFKKFWEWKLVPTGTDGLRPALSEMIARLRRRLIGGDPSTAAHDDATVQNAKAEGVPVERKPTLNGPEGSE